MPSCFFVKKYTRGFRGIPLSRRVRFIWSFISPVVAECYRAANCSGMMKCNTKGVSCKIQFKGVMETHMDLPPWRTDLCRGGVQI